MWSEGICGDGAAILKDGVMTPIEDVVKKLNDCDRYRWALEEIAMKSYSTVHDIATAALRGSA